MLKPNILIVSDAELIRSPFAIFFELQDYDVVEDRDVRRGRSGVSTPIPRCGADYCLADCNASTCCRASRRSIRPPG